MDFSYAFLRKWNVNLNSPQAFLIHQFPLDSKSVNMRKSLELKKLKTEDQNKIYQSLKLMPDEKLKLANYDPTQYQELS